MPKNQPDPVELSGSLLIAHPGLLDPNFRKSVVLLSAHTEDDGSLGVIINRPLGQTLSEMNGDYAYGPLAQVPVYEGGPVQTEQMLLAAWHWLPTEGAFRLYFGISEEKATELLAGDTATEVRAFLGYAGWSKGQLDAERQQQAWLISPVNGHMMEGLDGPAMWREILAAISPDLTFLADAPENPEMN